MEKKHLKYVGADSWGRIVFQCVEDGRYMCPVHPLHPQNLHRLPSIIELCETGHLALYNKDDFDSEPGFPVKQQFIFEPFEPVEVCGMHKDETNVEWVTRIMERSRCGPIMQCFVIECLVKWSKEILKAFEADPDCMKDSIISAKAWRACAEELYEEFNGRGE
jgi:hypothetical protein